MMGPWLISGALLLGATVFLYDGAPDWPAPDRLWDTAARQRITTLGLAPTGVRALMRADPDGPTRHDLSGLRALASSGEPWNPEPWWWYFRQVGGGRCPLINYSGGTEISGGIVAATTVEPQQPCAFAGPVPGMAADVVDEAGQPIRGRVGELVLRAPWVGMTNGFWQDRERYLETYWSRWPGVWAHGDWALIADDGSWYIHGRSDDTLNIGGKRIGPAEVESAAVTHPAVAEGGSHRRARRDQRGIRGRLCRAYARAGGHRWRGSRRCGHRGRPAGQTAPAGRRPLCCRATAHAQ